MENPAHGGPEKIVRAVSLTKSSKNLDPSEIDKRKSQTVQQPQGMMKSSSVTQIEKQISPLQNQYAQ